MDVEIRTIREEEFDRWVKAEGLAFGSHATDEWVAVNDGGQDVHNAPRAVDLGAVADRTVPIPLRAPSCPSWINPPFTFVRIIRYHISTQSTTVLPMKDSPND